jgi:serine protease Do
MERSTKRAISFSALVAAAIVFGMVVAGSVDVTPRSEAQKDAPARTSARAGGVLLPSFADIASETMPSVVSITSTDIVHSGERRRSGPGQGQQGDPFEFFFGQPFGRDPRGQDRDEDSKEQQGGTGFVISSDGEVVTNYHVVENADKIQVRLSDGRTATAKLVGRDPATDLALLKVDLKDRLPALALGDSEKVRVGEWVMAIGDPLNFDKTVTVGVVSAKGRSGLSSDQASRSFDNFIQTDAAINFGNSGGPLINVDGEVVGINTAIFRPAQNIGFAVPVNTLRSILPQLREKGKVVRGYLGINIENVNEDKQDAFGLKSRDGAFVQSVLAGKPGEKAGLKPGDVIVKVDDVAVHDTRDLISYVSGRAPGSKVKLSVTRDGKEQTMTAVVAARDDEPSDDAGTREASSSEDSRRKIGISVTELTPQLKQMQRIDRSIEGLLVVSVKEVSPAADANVREGDVITEVNGRRVDSSEEFGKVVGGTKAGEYLRLYVYRPAIQQSFFALVKMEG